MTGPTAPELAAAVRAAADRLRPHVERTPLLDAGWLEQRSGAPVRLKLENVQRTGSFKVRGATNALLRLSAAARERGVVAASSGNHGLGLAAAARQLGVSALVFVPETTPAAKRSAIAAAGAEVAVFGPDCVDTEAHAREFASANGRHYVSPYNDPDVIAGQGTVAVEILEQWPQVERLYVAVGGGGLIGGMASWVRSTGRSIEVVGCSPSASPAMAECVRSGRILDVECGPTLSDSTAGGVEPGAVTFPLCRDLVDRYVDLDEPAIASALVDTIAHQHQLIEGAAAVAVAGLLADAAAGRPPQRSAIVVCGGNLPLDRLRELLAKT